MAAPKTYTFTQEELVVRDHLVQANGFEIAARALEETKVNARKDPNIQTYAAYDAALGNAVSYLDRLAKTLRDKVEKTPNARDHRDHNAPSGQVQAQGAHRA